MSFPDAPEYGLGMQRMQVACGTDEHPEPVTVWETDGGGPGCTSLSLTTADGDRQLVLAAKVVGRGAELKGDPPASRSTGPRKAQTAVLYE